MAVMQANGTLHGPASQGGFEVPKALFRTTGFLTDAGGNSVSEYRRLVLDESKAEKAAVQAESQQSDLSRSVSRAASDLESVQSGLSASSQQGMPGSRPRIACAARTVTPSTSVRASSQRP